jgi:hypothetical protein
MDYLEMHELYHSGVKGQQWGVRRYQNKDGTLTPEGKIRYGVSIDRNGNVKMSNSGKKLYEEDKDPNLWGKKRADDASSIGNAVKSGVESAKNLPMKSGSVERKKYSDISDEELQKRVNRLNLEQRYSDLNGDTKYVKSGGDIAREILQTIGAIVGIGVSATMIISKIYEMKSLHK